MSILILAPNGTSDEIGAAFDRIGIPDWQIDETYRGEAVVVDCGGSSPALDATRAALEGMSPGPARVSATTPEATALATLQASARCHLSPLPCGLSAVIARQVHSLNNALTPALINTSMARMSLKSGRIGTINDDLAMIQESLRTIRSRLAELGQCIGSPIISRDPLTSLRFLDRPDSPLRAAHPGPRIFELEETPPTALGEGELESWLLAAVPGLARSARDAPVILRLSAAGDRAALQLQYAECHFRHPTPLVDQLQRAVAAAGGRLSREAKGMRIVLPPARPPATPVSTVGLTITDPTVYLTLKRRLTFLGIKVVDEAPECVLVDRARWLAGSLPPNCLVVVPRDRPGPVPTELPFVTDAIAPVELLEALAAVSEAA